MTYAKLRHQKSEVNFLLDIEAHNPMVRACFRKKYSFKECAVYPGML